MPTPPEIARSTSMGATLSDDIYKGPQSDPDSGIRAPAGEEFSQSELPVRSVDAPPATYGGYRPDAGQEPLPGVWDQGIPPHKG